MKNKKNFSFVSDSKTREKEQTGVKHTNKITDIDSMLKDHLKASISMERLEVSEDLVQRTLQKIKQTESETASDVNNRTSELIRRNRKLRRFASAAAAIVIVVASVTVWQSGMISIGNKETNDTNKAVPHAEIGIMDITPATGSEEGDALDYGIMSTPDTLEEYTLESAENSIIAKDAGSSMLGDEKSSLTSTQENVFSINYFIASFHDVTSFVVTKAGEQSINIADKIDKAQELYGLLDQFAMSIATDSLEDDWTYKTEIMLQDNRAISIYIWDSGNLAVEDSATNAGKNFYAVDEATNFLEKYSEFYSSLY